MGHDSTVGELGKGVGCAARECRPQRLTRSRPPASGDPALVVEPPGSLPQPHGFEGVSGRVVAVQSGDPPIADGVHLAVPPGCFSAACGAGRERRPRRRLLFARPGCSKLRAFHARQSGRGNEV
jgi:hypothetical protein